MSQTTLRPAEKLVSAFPLALMRIAHRSPMDKDQMALCERLKRLGFSEASQMRLYGQEFTLQSGPIIMSEHVIFVDAVEKKSQQLRRVRIPLPVVHMASHERRVA